MLTKRIIPCLDVKNGRVVKGVKFSNLQDAGSPQEMAAAYESQGADELVFLDVSATPEGRKTALDTVASVRAHLAIPLSVGGGVREKIDAAKLLEAGADKVAMNTAAVTNPKLIQEIATDFGRQCTVLAVDAARTEENKEDWEVVVQSGKVRKDINVIDWCKRAVDLGAGEILLTSWDRDGTKQGYDLALLQAVSDAVDVPIIASGGAANTKHLIEAFEAGADAVLAASIFHYGELTVGHIKSELATHGIEVRL